jgi:hypothetical protein
VPAHQELALRGDVAEDEEPIVEEAEPELEAEAELTPPEAESIGPDTVEPVTPEEELESEAPADAVATHDPSAEAVAEAEGEVDLDVSQPEQAPPDQVPGGVPIETVDQPEEESNDAA